MTPVSSPTDPRSELRRQLGLVDPFSSLDEQRLDELVAAAAIAEYRPGELVLDGFHDPSSDVFLVLSGKVGLWQEVDSHGMPDDTEGPGGFFGFSGMLTGRSVGPRASALTRSTIARIPRGTAARAFVTPEGARFLTDHLLSFAEKAKQLPGFVTTGALLDGPPVVVDADTSVREVARELTARPRMAGVVVRLDDGSLGLVTDGSLRRTILLPGLPLDTPAAKALARGVPIVQVGDSAGEVLIQVLEAQTDAAIVTDHRGRLRGVVGLREFSLTPTTADVALHEQLRLAASRDELVQRVQQTPQVLSSLLSHGLASDKVIRVQSGLIDVIVRRAIELCFADHPDLSLDGFTWLALGSNGRREAVLSSDIESAVVFPDGTPEELMARYRAAFAEVDVLLSQAGLAGDGHGVSARHAILARTESEWNEAAHQWLEDPRQDKGAIMISLMVDSRPVFGDPLLAGPGPVLRELRQHPGTMRDLLTEALSRRAKSRQWEMPWRRTARFDLKGDAVLPLVNLARWVALARGSEATSTPNRLAAAAGSSLLESHQTAVLAEAFDVVQRVRLKCQLDQVRRGQEPSDRIRMDAVSPIDRSILGEAVHEIVLAQRRLTNLSAWSEVDDFQGRRGPAGRR